MKIGYLQFDPKFGNKKLNLKTIEKLATSKKSDLLVLPELAISGYMFRTKNELKDLAESIPDGDSVKKLIYIAKKAKTTLAVGMPEIENGKYYNTSVVIGARGYVAKHQK